MERWLPVVGFEGLYEVSDLGRVRTVERRVRAGWSWRIAPAVVRRPTFSTGYARMLLTFGEKREHRAVHLMVLEAFVGPRPTDAHEGCHGDGDTRNNALSNLRWGTPKENKADSFEHGTAVFGERVGIAKLTLEQVLAIRDDHRGHKKLSRAFGISRSQVKRIRRGAAWCRAIAEAEGA